MKYLRLSFFPRLLAPPVTTVMAAEDMTLPVEEARERAEQEARKQGSFVIGEVFEFEGSLEKATVRAGELVDAEGERHMATLYFWTVMQMQRVRDNGSIVPDPTDQENYPAPLSGEQARAALEQVALVPGYNATVSVLTDCQDGSRLQLLAGEVTNRHNDGEVA